MLIFSTDSLETPWRVFSLFAYMFLGVLSVFAVKYQKLLLAMASTFPRDILGCYRYFWVKVYTRITFWTNQTMFSMFDRTANRKPHQVCWYFEDEIWTFKKVQEFSFQIGNYFQSQGYNKGDRVALLMENRPEFPCVWLGLSRIGVVTSLLNWNLRHESLQHCIKIADCKAIIYGNELTASVKELLDEGGLKDMKMYSMKDRSIPNEHIQESVDLDVELEKTSAKPVKSKDRVGSLDPLVYVYTSGTTGMPKAAILRNSRAVMFTAMYIMQGMSSKDVLMTPVPLYHLLGGISGVGLSFCFGIPQVLVRRFSASRFWKDAVRYDVTICQYLGEIIRYLYNQPECPEEKKHNLRFFFGNGVNPGIWKKFVDRFNTRIQEMYGSTEGNANIINFTGHIGAAGFVPLFIWRFVPAGVVKVDQNTGELIRDPVTGLGIECEFGEPGEFVGCIKSRDPLRQFDGYTDKESSNKKIANNVFRQGDAVFRTGDILVRDIFGYLYFKDRFGDTFRWKGENVSTAEVEGVVVRGAGMKAAVVYGVLVDGNEGRAGMTTIADPEGTLDLNNLTLEIIRGLPKYARPLFLRIIKQIKMTGTFKLQKVDLQKEGFNVENISDKLYFLDLDRYIPLDKELYSKIITGQVRL